MSHESCARGAYVERVTRASTPACRRADYREEGLPQVYHHSARRHVHLQDDLLLLLGRPAHLDLVSGEGRDRDRAAPRIFDAVDKSEWPEGHLYDFASLKEHFVKMYNAGHVPPEFVGVGGYPGLAWPPLEEYDTTHRFVMGAP